MKAHNLNIPPPMITREHGSWAVLIVPMLVSLGVAGKWRGEFVLFLFSALGVFLSYVPAQLLLRRFSGVPQRSERVHQAEFWGVVYAVVSLGFAGILVMRGFFWLLAIGAAGVIVFISNFYLTKKYSKSVVTDLLAVAGLTLSGPSAYYVLTGMVDMKAVSLYILNFLFFGCSVFYVHMKIKASASKKGKMEWGERLSLGRMNLTYYAVVVTIVGILAAMKFVPAIVMLAFIPMVVHGIYGTIQLSGNVRFKSLGLILLGQAVLFGSILSRTLR